MKLTIKSTITHKVVYDQDVTDKATSSLNYTFDIALPHKVDAGEYEYSLTDEGAILSSGIIQIGGYHADRKQHNKTITYKQYE